MANEKSCELIYCFLRMATIEWRNHLLPFLDEGSSHGTDKYTVVLLNHAFDSVLARPSNLDDRFTTFRNVWNNGMDKDCSIAVQS